MNPADYHRLIEECLGKDERAYGVLYKACFSFLMPVCMRYASSEEEARSYLNQGFYKLLKKLKKFDPDGNFEAWAKKLVIHTIIDEKRRHKRYHEKVDLADQQALSLAARQKGYHRDPDVFSAEDIHFCIRQLPETTASVFNLRALDGYAHKEIAEMLGISLSASKWHYARAKQLLQEMLAALGRQIPITSTKE